MTKKTIEKTDNETVAVNIPKGLVDRMRVYCDEKNITTEEFVIDAIGEKLHRSYKEKRKRPRL
jgi:hypothetical protein